MTKRIALLMFLLVGAMGFSNDLFAQKFGSIDKSPMDMVYLREGGRQGEPIARVIYSRPMKKDREVFGKLVPYGKVWRTGANEATEVTFYKDVKLGDQDVKAGTYSLFTIPNEKEWTIILNKDVNQWGAYSYKEANDVTRVSVPVTEGDESLEAFSIAFDQKKEGDVMVMGWDKTRVAVPITK
ncbi:DUF2911 domain-containing protein [Limibacter armeniacum]|uniref:DUF2911 domain-containing protein n=1 Tax=Limibacter armeniacum TaxID=466084 RepID=UPI002FE699D9